MPMLSRITGTFRSLFRKGDLDRTLDAELEAYLDLLTQEKIDQGLSQERARREARLELGGAEQVKEHVRDSRLGASVEVLFQDVRFAFRSLRREFGFTLVVVLILSVGIGSTTALFSTINSVLLRPIPFANPDRLVTGQKTANGATAGSVSRLDYFDYRERSKSFVDLAALASFTAPLSITGGEQPEPIEVAFVTWNLFRTLGIEPIAGRGFLPEEERQGGAQVVVISDGLAQRRFANPTDAPGSVIHLEGDPFTIVGVMPRQFRFNFDADVWVLIDRDGPIDTTRDSHSHIVVGRLKPDVAIEEAQNEIDSISSGLEEQYPDTNKGKGLRLFGLHAYMVTGVRTMLLMLMATTVLVLLIACGNVAGLMLARGQRRHSEMAMRTALGASRSRLVRQLFTESIVLSLTACLVGIGVAILFQDLILRLLPAGDLNVRSSVLDLGNLSFALVVSLATGLLVGLVPAVRGTAIDLSRRIKPGTQQSEGPRSTRLRSGLVVLQVAVSIVLLIGSGLLMRSLAHLATVELGFDAKNLLVGTVRLQPTDHPTPEQRNAFFTSLIEEVEALPGVVSASVASKLPILDPWQDWGIWRADQPRPSTQDAYFAMARWASPGYFSTMHIPLLMGRDIAATDRIGTPAVVVISEVVARALFPDDDPLGQFVKIGWSDDPVEVIGVVGEVRLNTLRGDPDPGMYMSSAQLGSAGMRLAVRTAVDPALLVEPIRRLLGKKDPNALLVDPTPMARVLDEALADFRVVILSLGLFASVAVILTATGLYGVFAYHVGRRMKEIGIRHAVGASRTNLIGLILRSGFVLVAIGVALGVAGAFPATLLIQDLLFDTTPVDVATYVSTVGFLAFVALVACGVPAWRATSGSLVDVLRRD